MSNENRTEETLLDADGGGTAGANAEAARYRVRLRESEAANAALTERLATLQRAEVERIAASTLSRGDAIWLAGTELSDMLDDAGNVSANLVTQFAENAARVGIGRATRFQGTSDAGPRGIDEPSGVTWADVLQN